MEFLNVPASMSQEVSKRLVNGLEPPYKCDSWDIQVGPFPGDLSDLFTSLQGSPLKHAMALVQEVWRQFARPSGDNLRPVWHPSWAWNSMADNPQQVVLQWWTLTQQSSQEKNWKKNPEKQDLHWHMGVKPHVALNLIGFLCITSLIRDSEPYKQPSLPWHLHLLKPNLVWPCILFIVKLMIIWIILVSSWQGGHHYQPTQTMHYSNKLAKITQKLTIRLAFCHHTNMGTVHPRKFTCHPEKRTISKGSCIFQPWIFRVKCSVFRRVSNEIPVRIGFHTYPRPRRKHRQQILQTLRNHHRQLRLLAEKKLQLPTQFPSAKKIGEIAIVFVKKINGKHKSPCPENKKTHRHYRVIVRPFDIRCKLIFFLQREVSVLTLLLSWKTFCLTFPTGHHIQCRFEGQHLPDGRNALDFRPGWP